MGQQRTARGERDGEAAREGDSAALPVVLVEDRSDHREILADELEGAELGCALVPLSPASSLPRAARAIIASMESDPARVVPWISTLMAHSPPPELILLSGPEDRWVAEAERRWPSAPRLDKRRGLAFLGELTEMVRGLLGGRPTGQSALEGASALEERASLPTESDPGTRSPRPDSASPGSPVASLAFQEQVRRELLLAGILAGEVESLLSRLEALAGLFRHRVPGDPAVERYADCLADEVQRGQALTARIASLGREAHAGGARLMAPADLVKLRVAAWRRWLPDDAAIQIHLDGRAPRVAVWPEILGPLLDEVVGVVVRAESDVPRLSLRVDVAYRESTPEVHRWARLELAGSHPLPEGVLSHEDLETLLERARTVMAAHGGEVEHAGLDAGGTSPRVALLLPAAPFEGEAEPRGQEALLTDSPPDAAQTPVAPGEARSARVLIVDDDESVREIAGEMLEIVGHEPHSVSSGEAAVELYEKGDRFDLVLLDMQMAGMDGRRTFNAMRRIDPQVRAILVSGSATGTEIRTLLSEGLLGFLAKPFSVTKLQEVVESALREA